MKHRVIRSSSGHEILIDASDYDRISRYTWTVFRDNKGRLYAHRQQGERHVYIHRFILGVKDPEVHVDHINGNGLDNRRSNLRPCSTRDNQRNQHAIRGKSSRFKGVWWHKHDRKWKAAIRVDGKRINLGSFDDEVEAAVAYDAACIKYFGEFARPNLAIYADRFDHLRGVGRD